MKNYPILILFLILISSCIKPINYEEEKENIEIKIETVYFKNNPFDGLLYGVDFVILVEKGYKSRLTRFYESGNIKYNFTYNSKGELHGEQFQYYENGQLKVKYKYQDGKLFGEQFEYFENGKIKKKGNYDDAWLEGDQIEYYENGQIKRNVKCKRYPYYIVDYFENGNIKSDIVLGDGYSTTILNKEYVSNENKYWDFYNSNQDKEWFIENNER